MASALVTCGKLLNQLIQKLRSATPIEKQAIVEALGLSSNNLKDCNGLPLAEGSKIPTCEQMDKAIQCAVGAKECTYRATVMVNFGGDECGVFSRVGWIFHEDDARDPEATTKFMDCQGNVIGWLYPSPAPDRMEFIDGCSDTNAVLGYVLTTPEVKKRFEDCNC